MYSTFEARKDVFYFSLKALFILEIFGFENFRTMNFMTHHQMLKHETKINI